MFHFDDSRKYQKVTESRAKVRFQDCDPLQHLNNAKYLDYFFNAREDQVPQLYGVEMADIFKAYQAAWVVYSHQINYLRPATISEWIRVFSSIVWYNQDTLVVEYFMTDDEKSQLKNILWTTLKFVDVRTGKKINHPTEVMKFVKAAALDVDFQNISINQRIKNLKQQLL